MANAEAENPPDTLHRVSVGEAEPDAEELIVFKTSVLSHSYEPKLSTIVEENGTSVEKLSFASHPQKVRLQQLSRPKLHHLEETLQRLKNTGKDNMNERIGKIETRLRELRGSEKAVRQLQAGKSSVKFSRNSELIYNNLQSSLRKAAFEMLAKQIFDKMPELIVKMQHTRAQQMAPEMKALLDTLQGTLNYYVGQPTNEHEKCVFNHLCYGLAKFIEFIIENVHKNHQESERVAQDGKSGNGHYPVAIQLGRKDYIERQ